MRTCVPVSHNVCVQSSGFVNPFYGRVFTKRSVPMSEIHQGEIRLAKNGTAGKETKKKNYSVDG